MTYRYRCDQCRTTSPPVATRADAETERARHRLLAHGAHIPDHERIEYEGAGLAPETRSWLVWLVAGATAMAIWNWIAGR